MKCLVAERDNADNIKVPVLGSLIPGESNLFIQGNLFISKHNKHTFSMCINNKILL